MLKLMTNLTNAIDNNIYIDGEDFLNQGGWKKRQSDVISGAREKESYSRREAALHLGISPKELKAIEKGIKAPSKKIILKMAELYKVSLLGLWKYAV